MAILKTRFQAHYSIPYQQNQQNPIFYMQGMYNFFPQCTMKMQHCISVHMERF